MARVLEVMLNSGRAMPVVGFGTSSDEKLGEERMASVILDAIEAGYRHFDTAPVYVTERAAVREAVGRGLLRAREEVFVISKLWCTDAHPDLILPAITEFLRNLGLDYLDLYLIHWPARMKKELTDSFAEGMLPFDMESTWAAMEECQRLGLAKAIGISNFSTKKLSQLLLHAKIPPAVVQVEMNPLWDQRSLRTFCDQKGIHVVAWSPLGGNGARWGSLNVVESPVLKEIARRIGKSLAQVALRWVYEQGASLVVKSYNSKRMRENLEIFDWELGEDDREKI